MLFRDKGLLLHSSGNVGPVNDPGILAQSMTRGQKPYTIIPDKTHLFLKKNGHFY